MFFSTYLYDSLCYDTALEVLGARLHEMMYKVALTYLLMVYTKKTSAI